MKKTRSKKSCDTVPLSSLPQSYWLSPHSHDLGSAQLKAAEVVLSSPFHQQPTGVKGKLHIALLEF
jgi:hypothetical protein